MFQNELFVFIWNQIIKTRHDIYFNRLLQSHHANTAIIISNNY